MSALKLDSSVRYLKGVGPRRAEQLESLEIRTVWDLIEHFPFRYGTQGPALAIAELCAGEQATVVGTVTDARLRSRGRRAPIQALIEDETGECQAVWFQSPWLAEKLQVGDILRLFGKVTAYDDSLQFANPRVDWLSEQDKPRDGGERFEPVYPGTNQISSRQLMRWICAALPTVRDQIVEFHDAGFLRERRLPARVTAYERIHAPLGEQDSETARRRLAYDELLLTQLAIALRRMHRRLSAKATPIPVTDEIDRRIRDRLVFRFTRAQDRTIAELRADLAQPWPMNRLLQGDVGAGKTAIAVYATLAGVARRLQTAIMAPTEILARQHFGNVERYLAGSRVRRALVTGGMSARERRKTCAEIAAGKIDLVIGTHALLDREIKFAALGLVVIDEQHKFGVIQRSALRRKGVQPHLLTMSATPIPRSLAMTAFGELDMSVIDELPPGRKPVTTRLITSADAGQSWAFVREQLKASRQVFVVYPLVAESETLPLRAASAEVLRLSEHELRGYRATLLHGKMKSDEKQAIMAEFRAGRIQVLVATTVVEVGVDVPNATVMVIQHAERYGLSQLHQLRGRIGRGSHAGHCLLMADSATPAALRRLEVLVRTTDGFEVAEEDLRHRGPGQILGTRQHGEAGFRVARLPEDFDLLELAARDARQIVADDSRLDRPDRAALREELIRRYGKLLALLEAG